MKLVEIIPIVRGLTKSTLSYFSKERFDPGSLVKVPVKNGSVLGIVQSTKEAKNLKTSIKRADFSMKKISSVESSKGLPESFMKAVLNTADFYATTAGSILSAVVPKTFLDNPTLISNNSKTKTKPRGEVRLVQLTKEERFREYRGIVRESFAQGKSVFFIAPTKEDLINANELLSLGIEDYTYTTVGKTELRLKKLLQEIKKEKHPILLLMNQTHLAFQRGDLGTIILEKENSKAYKTLRRPFINIKNFLENYAKSSGIKLVLGDSVLSLETLWQEKEGRYIEATPLTWRIKYKSTAEIVDMQSRKSFNIFSERLLSTMKTTLYEGKNIYLFSARKGLHSITICGDCASLLLCKNCSAPLVLHERVIDGEKRNIYICHHCGAKRNPETRCDHCQSWKLNPLGIGVDTVVNECKEIFPEVPVFLMDKDNITTTKQAKDLIKKFESERGAILVGTELPLTYLKNVSLVSVVSMDSLLSIPDFHINERIFRLISKLREIAQDNFLIQTRNAGAEVFDLATAGNILDFYRNEIKEREELNYPPFSIFIKVSTGDKEENLKRKAVYLQGLFGEFSPHFMQTNKRVDGVSTLSMIVRVRRQDWPDKNLLEKLLLLTPDFLIKVDPESIL